MRYPVIAECVDARTGKRYFAGDTFDPAPDADQAIRLLAAGVITEDDSDGALRMFLALADDENGAGMKLIDLAGYRFVGIAVGREAPADPGAFDWGAIERDAGETGVLIEPETDGLDELLVAALKDIAAKEDVTLEPRANKAAIIAAIRAKRAESATADEGDKSEDDGLDALDDAALAAKVSELGVTVDAGADRAVVLAAIRAAPKVG